jgi:hypothetical protein
MGFFDKIFGSRANADDPTAAWPAPTGPDGLSLSAATTEADLLTRLGPPESRQDFEDQSILYYMVGPLVSEFELDSQKRLLAWTVYPD